MVLEKVTAQTEDLSKSLAEHFICYLGLADVMNKIGSKVSVPLFNYTDRVCPLVREVCFNLVMFLLEGRR